MTLSSSRPRNARGGPRPGRRRAAGRARPAPPSSGPPSADPAVAGGGLRSGGRAGPPPARRAGRRPGGRGAGAEGEPALRAERGLQRAEQAAQPVGGGLVLGRLRQQQHRAGAAAADQRPASSAPVSASTRAARIAPSGRPTLSAETTTQDSGNLGPAQPMASEASRARRSSSGGASRSSRVKTSREQAAEPAALVAAGARPGQPGDVLGDGRPPVAENLARLAGAERARRDQSRRLRSLLADEVFTLLERDAPPDELRRALDASLAMA